MIFSRSFRLSELQQAARQFANRARSRRRRFDMIVLVVLIILAIVFRVWNLGAKALWLDEWLTAFVTNGYGLADLPLDHWLAPADLFAVATPHPDASLLRSVAVLGRESTHPPLFFSLQHLWVQFRLGQAGAIAPDALPALLRTLPAAFGILQTIAAFLIGKQAFSPRVGLLAAGLTATSPLAIYLSQEARHYTLAMLCFVLALRGLLSVVKRWQNGDLRARKAVLLWIGANTLGLYTHYLYLLAFVAQAVAIGLWLAKTQQWRKRRRFLTAVVPGFSVPLVLFLPWLWLLLAQVNRGETEWARPFGPHWSDFLAPIGQTLVGMLSAFIVLPIEGQSQSVAIGLGAIVLLTGLLLAVLAVLGWQRLEEFASASPESARLRERRWLVLTITSAIVAQMLAAFYLFGKNLTIAPRYHAIYYPALGLALAIGFSGHSAYRPQFDNFLRHLPVVGTHWRRSLVGGLLAIGAVGAVCVTQNLAFQKGYTPREIATRIQPAATASVTDSRADSASERPTFAIAAYENLQEAALGWSVLWEVAQRSPDDPMPRLALLDRRSGYPAIWSRLADDLASLPVDRATEFDLWVLAPGLRQTEFPQEIAAASSPDRRCTLDEDRYDRVGIPYQGYRCSVGAASAS